jgi:hypothetical protein
MEAEGPLMETVDLKKTLHPLYHASAQVVTELDIPPMNYLMIDGAGDPNLSPAYTEAVEALFAVAYALKFKVKKSELAVDYSVMPLEGLWWSDDMATFSVANKAGWLWTMLILQPPPITAALVADAVGEVGRKKRLPALPLLRFDTFSEGRSAQILHVGPFATEAPTIETLHRYIDARGQRRGKHHEIYLSDIRQADPARWKTIIRQPMA